MAAWGSLARILLLATSVTAAVSAAAEDGTGLLEASQVVRLDDGTVVQDYAVYTGSSMPEVRAAYGRADKAWCGLPHFLQDSPNCTVAISPFGSTFVAVAKPKTWLAGGGGDPSRPCQLTRSEELSMPRLLAAVLGGFLFWNAGVLSESTPFRLTGGTVGFMALSSVILLFVLYRKVPHKGKLLAGSAVFGSTFLAAMRWLFGVLRHPATLGYLGLSGLAGMGLTYYYNNSENRKVNNMLRVALQLTGLAAVYFSASMSEASIALCVGLLGLKAARFIRQRGSLSSALASAKRNVQQQLAEEQGLEAEPEAPTRAAPAARRQAAAARHTADAAAAAAAGPSSGAQQRTPVAARQQQQQQAVPEVSPLIERGLVLNEETGHIIGIGKATYNRLVDAGYVVDRTSGTITPPPPSPKSPAKTSRGLGKPRRRN
ncbi:Nuclear envelope integral membrane protein 1 [Chlorella vulgaris]